MAKQVKIVYETSFEKAEKVASKFVGEGWEIKGATTAMVTTCCATRLNMVIVLEKSDQATS